MIHKVMINNPFTYTLNPNMSIRLMDIVAKTNIQPEQLMEFTVEALFNYFSKVGFHNPNQINYEALANELNRCIIVEDIGTMASPTLSDYSNEIPIDLLIECCYLIVVFIMDNIRSYAINSCSTGKHLINVEVRKKPIAVYAQRWMELTLTFSEG